MRPTIEEIPAFYAAALAPALLVGVITLPFAGPFAVQIFLFALVIAIMHVFFLAIPIHALLTHTLRCPVRTGTVVIASTLIGAVPFPMLTSDGSVTAIVVFGLFGLVGGGAFLFVSERMWGDRDI